jgi:hypothetical protein
VAHEAADGALVELPLLRNTGEGGEGTSPSAGANTNVSHSVLPLPSPAPFLRRSTYHHPVLRMKQRHTSMGGGEEGRWVYKGRAVLVDLKVAVYPTPFPSHFAPEAAGRTHLRARA